MIEHLPFDYTSRDFTSLKADMERRLKARVPEWEPNDSAFESIILDLVAYAGDIINYYIDRMAAESFIQTAVLRESILAMAQMFGYIPTPQTSAKGIVRFTRVTGLVGNIDIPAGTQVYGQRSGSAPIIFETDADHVMTGAFEDINVSEGQTVPEESIGLSTGGERQVFPLFNKNVIKDSVVVYTRDGELDEVTGEPALVEWTYTDRLIDTANFERAFSLFLDDDGYTYVKFGDGVSGQIPSVGVAIVATYRFGVGVDGNVGVGAITSLVAGGTLAEQIATVTNSASMSGGANAESLESMRSNIPRSIRSLDRAVTLEDYSAIALRVGGVAKASANATVSTSVTLAVAPIGGGLPTTTLKDDVQRYIDERKMIGTTVTIVNPVYVPINVTVSVTVNSRYRRTVVSDAVKEAVMHMYRFDGVNFNEHISHAKVFREVVDISGVDIVSITAFNRDGAGDDPDFTLGVTEIPVPGTITINATGGINPL